MSFVLFVVCYVSKNAFQFSELLSNQKLKRSERVSSSCSSYLCVNYILDLDNRWYLLKLNFQYVLDEVMIVWKFCWRDDLHHSSHYSIYLCAGFLTWLSGAKGSWNFLVHLSWRSIMPAFFVPLLLLCLATTAVAFFNPTGKMQQRDLFSSFMSCDLILSILNLDYD